MHLYLTIKNACACVAAIAMILVVLSTVFFTAWRMPILALAFVAIVASVVLMFKQSADDHQLDGLIHNIIDRLPPSTEGVASDKSPRLLEESSSQPPDFSIELCHIAVSPRSAAYVLVKDLYRIQGHPEEAKIDCDVLMKMYVVNTADSRRFIKDIVASVNVGNQRIELERKDDLQAIEFNRTQYEYGVKRTEHADAEPIPYLYKELPTSVEPKQPLSGWVRFLAKNILPDAVDSNSWQIEIVDSVGTQWPITKLCDKRFSGEIGLLRSRG